VYKRALMLTAATVALLSGPALGAATTITTKTTSALTTADDGPITLDDGGSVTIASSSSAATIPAIEINSTTTANNILTGLAGSAISFKATDDAIAIQADPGKTGEILSAGTIDLTGTGSGKNAIVFGDPTLLTSGTFTGVADSVNNSGRLTALDLQLGSTLEVQGDGSSAIEIVGGNAVNGDILVTGAVTDEATSLTAVTNSTVVTAANISGTLTGNFSVEAGGSIGGTGGGAEGIVDLGKINGAITNFGAISAVGSTTLSKTTGNPEGGSALVIANNVTGGIYNGGPGDGDATTARAAINAVGTAPALNINAGFGATTTSTAEVPITIGGYTDPLDVFGKVSFLNRGSITGAPDNDDDSSSAVAINGVSNANNVTLTNGMVNAGSITASSTTDGKTGSAIPTTTAISIGDFVTVGPNTGTQTTSFGGGYALVNSNESQDGAISATVGGAGTGTAIAIDIGAPSTVATATGTSVPSLFNSGTISASATSTDTTVSNLDAYAIIDNSGTLVKIYNTGTIVAASTTLDNFTNVARAISLQDATSGVTITDSGIISGDILLGQHADTISLVGQSQTSLATVSGNVFFGGNVDAGQNDTLSVGTDAIFTGNVLEQTGSAVNASVATAGVLNVTNNGSTVNNIAISSYAGLSPSFEVSQLTVASGGTLDLTLAQAFNQQSNGTIIPIVHATQTNGSSGQISIAANSILNLTFGSFISPANLSTGSSNTSRFVIFDAPSGELQIADAQTVTNAIANDVPFLFNGSVCGSGTGLGGFSACTGANAAPEGAGHSDLVLNLTPKTASDIGLTGYAAKLFPLANQALANDSTLGAAVIAAGAGNLNLTPAEGQKIYQGIYSSFAPDVTGASRAIAISITDQATGPVGARQRALRMYAGLDGDATLWGQEFGQRLNVGNSANTTGYANTGWGFALGMDQGDPHDGRYGGAFTFFSGNTSEKSPRTSKTQSDWVMATGYTDWRGHGLFFDSQLSAGYGQLTGKRSIVIGDAIAKCNNGDTCTAEGKRNAALLAGGITTGTIYHAGGTVFIPQISLDGLTMREDGYTESTPNLVTQSTSGFDLHVKPYYANSLRAFAGADLRQDLKFGDYFVQPEARAGFRYDLLDGAQKLKAEFACSAVATGSCGDTSFSITGPDPAKGNLVLGGGFAVTTGAWSMGLNYDYLRGVDGTKSVDQVATFSLIGRI
jgi:hypothetical protein